MNFIVSNQEQANKEEIKTEETSSQDNPELSMKEENQEDSSLEDQVKLELEELKKKVKCLEEEKNLLQDQVLRKQADFDNYRKRVIKEKCQLKEDALADFMKKILPLLDNFERALDSSSEGQSFKEGVEMIYNQLQGLLKEEGLEVIPAQGEIFDPHIHQAVMQVESEECPECTVVEELQKGYSLKERVLRASMVKVAK